MQNLSEKPLNTQSPNASEMSGIFIIGLTLAVFIGMWIFVSIVKG